MRPINLIAWAAIASIGALAGCSPATEVASDETSPTQFAEHETPNQPPSVEPARQNLRDGTTSTGKKPHQGYKEAERTFEDLLNSRDDAEPEPNAFGGANFGHPQHDDAKLAAAGIRKIAGKQLTVYTDLPAGDVDDFPKYFDLALPQWQTYFGLDADKLAKWRMTAYVVKDKELFRRQGLIDPSLPAFQNGFQRGFEMWVYEQPSDYYRRHLFLHECTHGVMNNLLGAAGPPWYMEGVAELMATHKLVGDKLTLHYNPPNRDEVPYWGRVKIVRDDFAGDAGMQLSQVLNYDSSAHQNVNAYAWCWAACAFLDAHPQTQKAFRAMQQQVRLPNDDFNRRFVDQIADWPRIASEQWFLYVQSLDYGSDVAAAIVKYKDGAPLPAGGAQATIDTLRGWQSSGVAVEAGVTYAITAAGKFTIAREADGTPWPCEPNGITLRYYNGRPLGELLVAVRDGEPAAGKIPALASALPIGTRKTFTPKTTGTLYFKVNDSPAELGDNEGEVVIRIAPAK